MGKAINLRTPYINTMVKDISHVTMDFSTLSMYEMHDIHHVAVEKMKTKEHAFVNQVNPSHKTVKKL